MITIICIILVLITNWVIFKKMGREGWEGIVPLYSSYVLCHELYGNGWKFLLILVPLYNIYFGIKLYVDWAKAFNKGVGFAMGMLFLPFIFQLILAFGDATYKDGSMANEKSDIITQTIAKTKEVTAPGPKANAADELMKYKELVDKGVITQEEFDKIKKDLLRL